MNALEQPKRREMVFAASDESWQRIDSLMEQQGHQVYGLTIARGFALVQWVLEQQAAGRIVGSLETGEEDFEPLIERPDLLAPRPRLQAVPVADPAPLAPEPAPVTQPEPVKVPTAAVEAAPAPAAAPVSTLPAELSAKLVAREKKPPAPKEAPKKRGQNRAAEILRAHLVDDVSGPVKSHTWVRWRCEMDKRAAPIHVGDNRALPGELSLEHLPELECMLVEGRHATHFRITDHGALAYHAFTPGKGWCYLEEGSMRLLPDSFCDGGLFAVFPVVMAVEYLRRLANPSREEASV
jgi:hypothetical protein